MNQAGRELVQAIRAADTDRLRALLSVHSGRGRPGFRMDEKQPLDYALPLRNEEVCILLMDAGRIARKDGDQYMTLLGAASWSAALVRHLLDTGGFRPQHRSACGADAVHTCAQIGSPGALELLVSAGGDPNSARSYADGSTVPALCEAAAYLRSDILSTLCRLGADPRATDTFGDNALHHATRGVSLRGGVLRDTVTALLALGLDIDAPGRGGYTPLHMAVMLGRQDDVLMYLDAGARTDVSDAEGNTAAQMIDRGSNDAMKRYLNAARARDILRTLAGSPDHGAEPA